MSKRIDQKIKMGRRSENLSVPLGLFLSFSDTSQPALPPHCGRPLKRGSGLSAWPPLHPLPGAHIHSHHSSPCDTQTHRIWCSSLRPHISFHGWFWDISIWKYAQLSQSSKLEFIFPWQICSLFLHPCLFGASIVSQSSGLQTFTSPEAAGRGKGELVFNGSRVSVWEEEKVLEMDGDDGCTTM